MCQFRFLNVLKFCFLNVNHFTFQILILKSKAFIDIM